MDAAARGMGLGAHLINECICFARAQHYQRVVLWTYSFLEGARRLYKRAGFQLIQTDPVKELYGKELVNEVWELQLSQEKGDI